MCIVGHMLCDLSLAEVGGGINLVDIGASGRLSAYWEALEPRIRLFACEPNEDECRQLAASPNRFAEART